MGHDIRRKQILAVATRLFGHYGLRKTTVADIAREAHIGVGTVYLEFRSKGAILSALCRHRHERILSAQRAAWMEGGSLSVRLSRLFRVRLELTLAEAGRDTHAADLLACASPAVSAARREAAETERTLLARLLAESPEAAALGDPKRAAQALLLAHAAFEAPSVLSRNADTLFDDLEALHDLLFARPLRPAKR